MRTCGACYGRSHKLCAGCMRASYCDPGCQRDAWAAHRTACRAADPKRGRVRRVADLAERMRRDSAALTSAPTPRA